MDQSEDERTLCVLCGQSIAKSCMPVVAFGAVTCAWSKVMAHIRKPAGQWTGRAYVELNNLHCTIITSVRRCNVQRSAGFARLLQTSQFV